MRMTSGNLKQQDLSATRHSAFEIVMNLTTLLGIVGLIALMARGAWAEGPNGFPPGGKAFNNPFAGQNGAVPPPPPTTENNVFPEDDDLGDSDLNFPPEDNYGATGGNTGGGGGGGGGGSHRGGSGGGNAIQVGGTPQGGVIQHGNAPTLKVDTASAEGCKDIITDFNFPDADILDIAKTLGKLTGKNFILDKDVKGRVTIISNAPITCGDAWKAFLTALDINGFALIPSGKFVRIARQRDARDKQLPTYTGDYSPDTDALVTRVFPLKYLSAEEVARNFRSFMPANSRIIPYEQTNTVIVTDTGSNIAKLGKLLEILDVEGYDAGIEVIPVKYAAATDLSKLIDTLIPGAPTGAPGGAPRFGGGGKFTARRTKEGGIINTIISDERTNTLIVHANTKGAEQIRELVNKLDQKNPANSGGGKVHVVYLQFADAEQIGATLNNLSSQSGGGRPSTPGGGTGINPVQTTLFEGSIKVAPDKSTNSLVITASPGDFVVVQRVINRLDIPRDQVFAEVVIMEIALRKQFDYSANLVLPQKGLFLQPNGDLLSFLANPAAASTGGIFNFSSGGSKTFKINGADVAVPDVSTLIKAIQTNTNANVLATPQILALDNSEANFESTEKVPLPSSNASSNGTISNSIQKEPVTLSIQIKPQINKLLNFVKMEITAKLEAITQQNVPRALTDTAFATTSRVAKTSVVVADKDTVVMGGLVRDNVQETVSKIPILGDIPVLGWLFRSKATDATKQNLLIFITPHIVRQYEGIRTVLDRKLKERDEFIEKNAGGEDVNRAVRDKMIRELPDLNKTLNEKPKTSFVIEKDNFAEGEPSEDKSNGNDVKNKPGQAPGVSGAGTPAPEAGPAAGAQPSGTTGETPAAPTAPAEGAPKS